MLRFNSNSLRCSRFSLKSACAWSPWPPCIGFFACVSALGLGYFITPVSYKWDMSSSLSVCMPRWVSLPLCSGVEFSAFLDCFTGRTQQLGLDWICWVLSTFARFWRLMPDASGLSQGGLRLSGLRFCINFSQISVTPTGSTFPRFAQLGNVPVSTLNGPFTRLDNSCFLQDALHVLYGLNILLNEISPINRFWNWNSLIIEKLGKLPIHSLGSGKTPLKVVEYILVH